SGGRDRPSGRPGGPRRGRQRDLRTSRRIPADPGPDQVQRDALTLSGGAAKAPRVADSSLSERPRGRVRLASLRGKAAPTEQPPPESLRPQDRAGLTVWKVPARALAKVGRRRGKALRR